VPFERVFDALGRVVGTGEDVLDAVLGGEVVHRGEEGVILRCVQMRDSRLEERQLEVFHLLPVDDLGVEVKVKGIDKLLDVVDGFLRVPSGVDVEHEGSEAKLFFCEVSEVGAVDSSADAHDAVEVLANTFIFNLVDGFLKLFTSLGVGAPYRLDVFEEAIAVVAHAIRVESDFRIGGVHDAVCADLVRARTHIVIVLGSSEFSLGFV